MESSPFTLTWRDSVLYALAVGAARGPRFTWAQEERYVCELHPRFATLPTLACTFALRSGTQSLTDALAGAGLRFDPTTLLHTEQVVRLHSQGLLPSAIVPSVSLLNSTRLVSVAERAGGTLARVQTETRRSSDGAFTAATTVRVIDTSRRRSRLHLHRGRAAALTRASASACHWFSKQRIKAGVSQAGRLAPSDGDSVGGAGG